MNTNRVPTAQETDALIGSVARPTPAGSRARIVTREMSRLRVRPSTFSGALTIPIQTVTRTYTRTKTNAQWTCVAK